MANAGSQSKSSSKASAKARANYEQKRERKTARQEMLRRFFSKLSVELFIAVLVLLSVGLTLVEFALDASEPYAVHGITLAQLVWLNDAITAIFIVELTLRWMAASSKRRFWKEYWIDILAVAPLFVFFQGARVVRLLRLVRLLRMFGVMSRLSGHLPDIMRKAFREYVVVCGMLGLTVVFGTAAMLLFEGPNRKSGAAPSENASQPFERQTPFDLEDSFWFSFYSLIAAEPIPNPPRTLGGKIVAVAVMFMGLTIFAMFTGTVSAFMVERLRAEGSVVHWDELKDHVVICGWNNKATIMIREFRKVLGPETPIVIITETQPDNRSDIPEIDKYVTFLEDDFTRDTALLKAGIERAERCIILSDVTGGRSQQDADARTVLAALTVEKLNDKVYTCAELLNRAYASHLRLGKVDDHVVSEEYAAYLLSQASLNRGLMEVFSELLTYTRGCEFYRVPLSTEHHGKTFIKLLTELKESHNVILVGAYRGGTELMINPPNYVFGEGDEVVIISEHEISL